MRARSQESGERRRKKEEGSKKKEEGNWSSNLRGYF
jgi:hypothetical protein